MNCDVFLLFDAIRASALRPETKTLYHRVVLEFIAYVGRDPKNWSSRSLTRWRDKLSHKHQRATTVTTKISIVRSAFTIAGIDSLGAKVASPKTPRVIGLTSEQIHTLVQSSRHPMVINALVFRGMSPREIITERIVTRPNGNPVHISLISKIVRDTGNRAGIPGVTVRALRRAYRQRNAPK